jgi:molybdate transport system substrate-binding protein
MNMSFRRETETSGRDHPELLSRLAPLNRSAAKVNWRTPSPGWNSAVSQRRLRFSGPGAGLRHTLPLLAGIVSFWLGVPGATGAELTVFAAASLTDALREIGSNYTQRSADRILFNFGASSLLARQIQEGAPADIFFSADEAKMDALEQAGLILTETRTNLLSNSLVIVAAADSRLEIHSPADLTNAAIRRIALADPQAVPAGIYSKRFLERHKLWTAVEPRVVPMDNVRAALAAVESGNVEAGMVFRTDAAISRNVKVAFAIAPRDGPEIRYPVAVIKESKQVEAAGRFVQYLNSDAAARIFEKHGFIVLP